MRSPIPNWLWWLKSSWDWQKVMATPCRAQRARQNVAGVLGCFQLLKVGLDLCWHPKRCIPNTPRETKAGKIDPWRPTDLVACRASAYLSTSYRRPNALWDIVLWVLTAVWSQNRSICCIMISIMHSSQSWARSQFFGAGLSKCWNTSKRWSSWGPIEDCFLGSQTWRP